MAGWNYLNAFLHYDRALVFYLCFHSAGFSTCMAKNDIFELQFVCHHYTSVMPSHYSSGHNVYVWPRVHVRVRVCVKCHPCYRSICTTSWKRATLLFTCLLAMLHRGLISRVDRSCNLKRGHCSSEQKQLKENERRPPRVKNRKLSTCMLESTTPRTTSCTSTHPRPPPPPSSSNLLGLHCYVWSDLPVLPLSSLSHFDLMKCNLEGNWVHHASRTMLPCCSKQEWHGTEALQRESLSFRSVCLTQN